MRLRFMVAMVLVIVTSAIGAPAQTTRQSPKPTKTITSPARPSLPRDGIGQSQSDTNLVTIPVIASTASWAYVSDLRKEEFSIFEDGVKQELALFAPVKTPFHVVLMLDTSARSEEGLPEKLKQIQDAAIAFVEQLQAGDSVKVISFDDEVRNLNAFSRDRLLLRESIKRTRAGTNTKLYDAMKVALAALEPIKGRKAIVLFTDGVDWHSDRALFDDALRALEESGIIVYPIRYDTRVETERLTRQQTNSPELPTIDVIRRTQSGKTPPTFPSEDPVPTPSARRDPKTPDVSRLPPLILGRPQEENPDPRTSRPGSDRLPDVRNRPHRDPNFPGDATPATKTKSRGDDSSLTSMLDRLYLTADSYLNQLAVRSGGRLTRADTLGSLPEAFRSIAAEIQTQYSLAYYPTKSAHDGSYRTIRVNTTRKDVVIRAKPGYRAPSGY